MPKQGKEMTTTPANSFVARARMCPGLRWVEEAQPQGELLNTLSTPVYHKYTSFLLILPNVFYNSTVVQTSCLYCYFALLKDHTQSYYAHVTHHWYGFSHAANTGKQQNVHICVLVCVPACPRCAPSTGQTFWNTSVATAAQWLSSSASAPPTSVTPVTMTSRG